MSDAVQSGDLNEIDKRLLFWASFLSLTAAGFGFAFRVAMGGVYGAEFDLTNHQIGQVFGATLWPIAITMIGFSLVVDRTGYKWPMYVAFVLQAVSGIGTFLATGYGELYFAALCAGLAHGIVEAVINPICAAVYPKEKTKWLTLLHASWPAGLVVGTLLIIGANAVVADLSWNIHALWIVLPAAAYAFMYARCKFPVDERVQAGVPYIEMLRQVGFLSAFLASFMVIYEIGNQVDLLTDWTKPERWFRTSLILGFAVGACFGLAVQSIGKPLFFLMCLLMIPVATAELGTDAWIKKLMEPVLEGNALNPALALVFSAAIMLFFRVFAGNILKLFSPPTLLCISGVFSAVGLWWLSSATGTAIFIAFVLYALGQTYYWPCVLGFTSERYPQGGALTLNTVSAIGLLSVGIIGNQLLAVAFDKSIYGKVEQEAPTLAEAAGREKFFLGSEYVTILPKLKDSYIAGLADATERQRVEEVYLKADKKAGRDVLSYAVRFPTILVVVFGLIALYFRSKGGYKPIELTKT
ncbi:MAG: MFS transporter [Planctomycetes bacterium]|jgi:MFS family permease|nr:MFS transporter [Planctomycetota bacterium]